MELTKISSERFMALVVQSLEHQKLVWLAGAGVSMGSPCSLPSGPEIKNLVVGSISQVKELRKYRELIRRSPKYSNIVPEIVFQRIYECIGDRLFPFFEILRFANPNFNHKILASVCMLKGSPILTTNFDLLIDQYLTPADLLIHLHGHIGDVEQMTITINRVGKGLQTDIARTMKHLTSSRVICAIGYSGNDNDIRRAIISSEAESILWLVRDWADPVIKNLKFLKEYPGSVFIAKWDLQLFFRKLARKYSVVSDSNTNSASLERERRVVLRSWSSELSLADRYAFISKLLIELEEYALSGEVSEKGFRVGKINRAGWFKNQTAFAMRMVGDFRRFARFANEAVRHNRIQSNSLGLAMAYNLLGLSKLEKPKSEPRKATPWFRKAIAVLQVKKDRLDPHKAESYQILLGQILNNLGLSLRHEGKDVLALAAYKRSLRLKRISGDLLGFSQTSINISLLYYRGRNFKAAYRWRRVALDLIRKFDLIFQEAYLMREMGSIACQQGRLQSGRRLLRAALGKYEQIETSSFGITLTKSILNHFDEESEFS
jgi:tetratricopeptide (TPR) repeat protein